MPVAGKLGRSGLSNPKINVRDFVDVEKAVATFPVVEQPIVNYQPLVKSWSMFLNDELGDCTCAALANGKKVFNAMVGDAFTVTDADVEKMYEGSGYVPGNANTDQGWTLEGAAQWAMKYGLQGTPDILGYAQVSLTDQDAQQVALELFGGLYEGAALPRSAETQYSASSPWVVTSSTPGDAGSWGGHCMWRPRQTLGLGCMHVTWGGLQHSTLAWNQAYVDELMVLVPAIWEKAMPAALVSAGIVDFAKLRSLVGAFTK